MTPEQIQLRRDIQELSIYMPTPHDLKEEWKLQKPIVSDIKKQENIAKAFPPNSKKVFYMLEKDKDAKPKKKSQTLVDPLNHQTPSWAIFPEDLSKVPMEDRAWCCPSVHISGIAAGMNCYNSGERQSCTGCQSPRWSKGKPPKDWKEGDLKPARVQNGKPMDHLYPKEVQACFQADHRFKPDAFGALRLQEKEYQVKGMKCEPLVKYQAVRTGLQHIAKSQFVGKMYRTEEEVKAEIERLKNDLSTTPVKKGKTIRQNKRKITQQDEDAEIPNDELFQNAADLREDITAEPGTKIKGEDWFLTYPRSQTTSKPSASNKSTSRKRQKRSPSIAASDASVEKDYDNIGDDELNPDYDFIRKTTKHHEYKVQQEMLLQNQATDDALPRSSAKAAKKPAGVPRPAILRTKTSTSQLPDSVKDEPDLVEEEAPLAGEQGATPATEGGRQTSSGNLTGNNVTSDGNVTPNKPATHAVGSLNYFLMQERARQAHG